MRNTSVALMSTNVVSPELIRSIKISSLSRKNVLQVGWKSKYSYKGLKCDEHTKRVKVANELVRGQAVRLGPPYFCRESSPSSSRARAGPCEVRVAPSCLPAATMLNQTFRSTAVTAQALIPESATTLNHVGNWPQKFVTTLGSRPILKDTATMMRLLLAS